MKRSIPLYAAIPILLLTVAVTFSATFFPMRRAAQNERQELISEMSPDRYDAEKIEAALDYLMKYSVYALPDSDVLTEAMIESVLAAMGDRHATYYNPEEHADRLASNAGNYYGVGVSIVKDEQGYAEIILVHKDSPCDGVLMVGDRIVAVDGEDALRLGYDETIDRIGGTKETVGEAVSISVLRDGEQMTFSVVRAYMTKQTVVSKTFTEDGKTIGYVLLTGFNESTVDQLFEAVLAHEAAGVDGLIFDVRSNGGGLLYSVSKILAFLLPDGEITHVDYASELLSDYSISSEDGKLRVGGSSPTVYYEGGHAVSLPMAVLINGSTASAAELFAKALSDYSAEGKLRCALVGTQSYGKGSVQTTDSSPFDSGAIKITVAKYTPPSGVSYDGVGITPDYVIELPEAYAGKSILSLSYENDTQLKGAIEVVLSMITND